MFPAHLNWGERQLTAGLLCLFSGIVTDPKSAPCHFELMALDFHKYQGLEVKFSFSVSCRMFYIPRGIRDGGQKKRRESQW